MRDVPPAGAAGTTDSTKGAAGDAAADFVLDGGRSAAPRTFGEALDRIRRESRSEAEKGRWFENLVIRLFRQEPELEIARIWRWDDWPGRWGRDLGIDAVAEHVDGRLMAIQCKCHEPRKRLQRAELDKFLNESAKIDPETGAPVFALRRVVSTCLWSPNARAAIDGIPVPPKAIHFQQFAHLEMLGEDEERPVRLPLPQQKQAIAAARKTLIGPPAEGEIVHDRCRLIMACGSGKTFTSLRIAEELVPDGGTILFAVPSIALAAGARAEWLTHSRRRLQAAVVCSDATAGGRNEKGKEDIGPSELVCDVLTRPDAIAGMLSGAEDDPGKPAPTKVLFCTYHSLGNVAAAQDGRYGAPGFDLAIADEAHRTTGVSRTQGKGAVRKAAALAAAAKHSGAEIDFQLIHDQGRLRAAKRLYMTATPRVYTPASMSSLRSRGYVVTDMDNHDDYGPEAFRLSFRQALEAGMLSEYRVIVMCLEKGALKPEMRERLEEMAEGARVSEEEYGRIMGTALAISGRARQADGGMGPHLHRVLAFANNRARSRFYQKAFSDERVLGAVTRRIKADGDPGKALKTRAVHLDATHKADERIEELRTLQEAQLGDECRMITNVRLFSEGVDVPALDAVAFLDPRKSQIDIVQAVGRVMRNDKGKIRGYIIVPVVLEPDEDADADIAQRLARDGEKFKAIGDVLKALQAHDGELAKNPARFVDIVHGETIPPSDADGDGDDQEDGVDRPAQNLLNLSRVDDERVLARICAGGLPTAAKLASDHIEDSVNDAAAAFRRAELEDELAGALGLDGDGDGRADAAGVDKIAALMLINACMLQERLRAVPEMKDIPPLREINHAENSAAWLLRVWGGILEKDYKPVFEPASAAARVLEGQIAAAARAAAERIPGSPPDPRSGLAPALRRLAERAGNVADSLSEMGLDHAGPLYHRILGTAKSDGAFYTNNVSAVMLARLALGSDTVDWSDPDAVARLRIMDPACGTGTLLMAVIHAIKARVAAACGEEAAKDDSLHKTLVENVLCGLDINPHAVQLAACNMTLGAPTVDYQRMNLATMPHGPVPGGEVRAGSLEILNAADETELASLAVPGRSLKNLDGAQVDDAAELEFPLRGLDLIIMNPPFTDGKKRGTKFDAEATQAMQARELEIRDRAVARDPKAGAVITYKAASSFFTPLAERLLKKDQGTLANVLPVTGCIGASGIHGRRFLAERFHIERIVTTHDPKNIAFSGNTSIHECLLIARRRTQMKSAPPPH